MTRRRPAPAAVRVTEEVAGAVDGLVEEAVDRMWADGRRMGRAHDQGLRRDLVAQVETVVVAVLDALAAGRPAELGDFAAVPERSARCFRQGVALTDLLAANALAQRLLWDALGETAARLRHGPDVVVAMASEVMTSFELAAAISIREHSDDERGCDRDREDLHRDTVEDLIGGRAPHERSRRLLAEAAGLRAGAPLVVAVVDVSGARDGVRDAAGAVSRALGGAGAPLVALGQDHAVVVARQDERGVRRAVSRLDDVRRRGEGRGVRLAVGISLVQRDLAQVSLAHEQARSACDRLGERGGILALSLLSPLDYVLLRDDHEARRLVPWAHRRFVEEELADGGALLDTVRAFAACDLNATEAAVRLGVHANTVYYRLDRVAERSGADPRRVGELMDLLVAIRLLEPDHAVGASVKPSMPRSSAHVQQQLTIVRATPTIERDRSTARSGTSREAAMR